MCAYSVYEVQDATRPALAILNPPDNHALGINEPFELSYAISDNSTGAVARLTLDGAVQGARETSA